jgi:hypothetical protein
MQLHAQLQKEFNLVDKRFYEHKKLGMMQFHDDFGSW